MTNFDIMSSKELRSFVTQIESLEEEKTQISDQIRDLYLEVKSDGFDTKIVRKVISLRKIDPSVRYEEEELLGLYMQAIEW